MKQDGAAEWRALVSLTGPSPRAPEETVDWTWLLDLAARHKVALLLARGVERAAGVGVPEVARRRLAAMAQKRAARTLLLARETAVLVDALGEAGIAAAVMKGAPLSQIIHGQIALRDPGDVDLIVPEGEVAAAASVLERLGFAAEYRALLHSPRQRERLMRCANQLEFIHPTRRPDAELHWRWQKIDGMMPLDADRVWGGERVRIGSCAIPTPDRVEHFIYLCAHGAGHDWMRLKWLNDIRWTLHDPRLIEGDWGAVAARARETKMAVAVAAAVLLAARIDGVEPPAALRGLIAQTPGADALSRESERWMLESAMLREDPPPPKTPLAISRSLLRHVKIAAKGRPGALATRLRILTAPSPPELAMIDLPRGAAAGYLIVRAYRALRRLV